MHEIPRHGAESDERSPLLDGAVLEAGDLRVGVRVTARRRRLGLTVERDGSVVLRAPEDCAVERAEAFLAGNRKWIDDKLLVRASRQPLHSVRAFRNGETYRYLGRHYRLLVEWGAGAEARSGEPLTGQPAGQSAAVRLSGGRLRLAGHAAVDPVRARRAIAGWYTRSGLRWARGRLQPWAARMEVPEPRIEVRDIGRRWGTYRAPRETAAAGCAPVNDGQGDHGTVALHWAVFQLPIRLVDYVIAHELAHARVAGHGSDYWRLLRRAMPECGRHKAELDELGRRVWMGDVSRER